MQYRRLGPTGLQVSALSFGSWVNFGTSIDASAAVEILAAARDAGINFLDNAEGYASGESERVMGEALHRLGWARSAYVVTTKFFRGLGDGPNQGRTLNRKYLLNAIDGSLQRFGLDYVDVAYAHRPDPHTPIEETVWAFHDIIHRGKALYWGTSEWSADEIRAAWDVAERHHLHKPVTEQPQYNLLHRRRVEQEYARLYGDIGLGLTVWSPLAGGLLSGKYLDGVPEGSRAASTAISARGLRRRIEDEGLKGALRALAGIAADLQTTLPRLSLAWILRNPRVSTVITGATSVAQLRENVGALDVLPKLDAAVAARIDDALEGRIDAWTPSGGGRGEPGGWPRATAAGTPAN
ncbi:aldo/keto reductase [Xylophilus sp.]|uniref:aldo/keto reductase n=1 Tax=Xylophilus sp. TaxID=2653893 RepID=UPI0013B69D6F|nr:aldo/keto reductase [Xylophilus sp.]KAF1047553.1 MAG: L-glyceraldehyde 3-phosphate reductase [Xylophilus sp.]